MSAWKVLVVANGDRGTIADALLDWGIQVIQCRTVRETRQILREHTISQVFCNANLPDGSYRDLIKLAKSARPPTRVVVLFPKNSGGHTFQDAIRAGAFDSIPSPAGRPEVQWEVLQAMRESSQQKAA